MPSRKGSKSNDSTIQNADAAPPKEVQHYLIESQAVEHRPDSYLPKLDMLAKGIITGVVASTITQTGRNLIGRLVKNPIVLFGLGLATGYLSHEYNQEILAAARNASQQGRSFAARKKEGIEALLVESKKSAK